MLQEKDPQGEFPTAHMWHYSTACKKSNWHAFTRSAWNPFMLYELIIFWMSWHIALVWITFPGSCDLNLAKNISWIWNSSKEFPCKCLGWPLPFVHPQKKLQQEWQEIALICGPSSSAKVCVYLLNLAQHGHSTTDDSTKTAMICPCLSNTKRVFL